MAANEPTGESSTKQGTQEASEESFLQQLSSPWLPPPLSPEQCPTFCCFYAEFDNIVGPQIVHQSPPNFMDQNMEISFESIHSLLQKTFNNDGEENKTTKQTDNEESIFDSTCDYIITGNELAGKMINLSTHNLHILARPTVISHERYERNSLFFCVGFVLRRTEDPRPFRPVLSKWADSLMRVEVEDHFLTHHKSQLQVLLRALLIRLNSGECNLLLHKNDSALHLKLFRPPKETATPVADHDVPVLLRQDWQVQMFDWDLAINWVVNNIDGISHAKALSIKSEVDPEMVRACLRVLKHHNVVAIVDMFFYSNRYEATGKPLDRSLLQEAIDYVCKRKGGMDDSERSVLVGMEKAPQHMAEERGGDWKKLKHAVAGLYYSFDRSQTVGEIFKEKVLKSQGSKHDWRSVLVDLDHRRFITFGIIHGIIQRVHNYPFAVVARNKRTTTKSVAYQVAEHMNGRTCDDALVCQFERPIGELVALVRTVGISVAELYAT